MIDKIYSKTSTPNESSAKIGYIDFKVSEKYPVPESLKKITLALTERGIAIKEMRNLCIPRSGEPAGKSAIITSSENVRELNLTNLYAPEWDFEKSNLQWWRLADEKIPGKMDISETHKITKAEQERFDAMHPLFIRAIKILTSGGKLELKETRVSLDSQGALNPIAVIADKESGLPILIIGRGTQSKNEVWTAEKFPNDRIWDVD